MAQAEWYVVQVQTGREERMCSLIEALCAQNDLDRELAELAATAAPPAQRPRKLLQECFSPRFTTQRKRMGRFVDVEHALLPGYVIAVTADPARLAQLLRTTPDFARVLVAGETYVPLSREDRHWLEEQTRAGERVVQMSFGYKRGDKLVVTSGPLAGREALVTKVDRARSLAHLELHVGAMTIRTTVGLAVVPEQGPDHTTE